MSRVRFTRLSQTALSPRKSGGLSTSRKSGRSSIMLPTTADEATNEQ